MCIKIYHEHQLSPPHFYFWLFISHLDVALSLLRDRRCALLLFQSCNLCPGRRVAPLANYRSRDNLIKISAAAAKMCAQS